ncbi:TPA: helix-turn-helix transcriptional regulator [Escherichia fergusonii]|nr:helix-turn-helix transcriptional regulator [Escherichia fergusonii]
MINIFAWINKNIESPINVEDLVKISGYSRRHLHTLFMQYTGHSVAEYVRLKRLSYTAHLLKLTNLSVLDISLRYHYDSPQSFSRVFKRYYQMTPLAYRRSQQWGKKIHFVDPCERTDVVYDFVYYEGDTFSGNLHQFHLDMSSRLDFWQKAVVQINDMKFRSLQHTSQIRSGVSYYPSLHSKSSMVVDYVYDDGANSKTDIAIASGDYIKISRRGILNDMVGLPNVLYRNILYAHNLIRGNGRDFEIIERDKGHTINFSYYIPVKM